MTNKITTILRELRRVLRKHPTVAKALHTFWQTFLGTVLIGLTPVFGAATSGKVHEAGVALVALFTAALASSLAAAKSILSARLA